MHRLSLLIIMILGLFTACSQPNMPPTPLNCGDFTITNESRPDCIIYNTGLLIQTPLNQQTQLQIDDMEITIAGTAFINSTAEGKIFYILEGTTVIGTAGNVQTISAGQQLTISASTIEDATPYEINAIDDLPFSLLQRKITIPQPTLTPEIIPTATLACPRPDTWTQTYQVQSGDTLTTIANAAQVTLQEMQTNNCIDNPNNLRVGMSLYIPMGSIAPLQPDITFTPSIVYFRADSEMLAAGDCTTLRWDVQNIRDVMLDGNSVINLTNQQVCPEITTTYTLVVDYFDNTQSQHQVTISITP